MKPAFKLRLLLMLGLLNACAAPVDEASGPRWQPIDTLTVNAMTGQTGLSTLSPSTDRSALRISTDADACYRVDRAVTTTGAAIVTPMGTSAGIHAGCIDCPWRTTQIREAGVLVLDGPASALQHIGFQRVDCRTGSALAAPGQLHIERMDSPTPRHPRVHIRLVTSTNIDIERLARDLSRELVDLEVVITEVIAIESGELRLTDRADHAALVELLATLPPRATDSFDLVIGPCLARVDHFGTTRLAGFTPRIPGGAGPADAVFVSRRTCGTRDRRPDPPEAIARVAAHEIGHYLGLFHLQEADGTQDEFDQTETANLMHQLPLQANAHGLTDAQKARMRAHPYVQ